MHKEKSELETFKCHLQETKDSGTAVAHMDYCQHKCEKVCLM